MSKPTVFRSRGKGKHRIVYPLTRPAGRKGKAPSGPKKAYRTFKGKRYCLVDSGLSAKDAQKLASDHKKAGFNARLLQLTDGWAVYTRGRIKESRSLVAKRAWETRKRKLKVGKVPTNEAIIAKVQKLQKERNNVFVSRKEVLDQFADYNIAATTNMIDKLVQENKLEEMSEGRRKKSYIGLPLTSWPGAQKPSKAPDTYLKLVERTKQAIKKGMTTEEIKNNIEASRLKLQMNYMYSAKGGIMGLPDSDKIQRGINALDKLERNLPQITKEAKGKMKTVPGAKTIPPKRGVRASYNKPTGWMNIAFDSKPSEDVRQRLKQHGFRWGPRSKTWYAKWSPYREDLLKELAGSVNTVDIEPDHIRKAQVARIQEAKHLAKAEELDKTAHAIMDAIPPGQPILVGHHSEKRHRKDLERIDTKMRKAREERDIADKFRRRAEKNEQLAVKGEDPVTLYRRIKRLEADEVNFIAQRIQAKMEGDEKAIIWATRHLEKVRDQLTRNREKYKRSGGIPVEHMRLKKGDVIETTWGKATVLKVNPETVKVEYHQKNLKMFSGKNIDKTHILAQIRKSEPEAASLRAKLWRTSIGHYGGRHVSVPAEHWEEFKAAIPSTQMPRNVKRKNVANTLTEQGEKRFNQEYSGSDGIYYELYFADKSKGLQTLDKLIYGHERSTRQVRLTKGVPKKDSSGRARGQSGRGCGGKKRKRKGRNR